MTTYYDRLKKQWEKEGMVKGKEESESKMAKLMGFLVREGRIADIEKASESPDYRKALLQEFHRRFFFLLKTSGTNLNDIKFS